MIRRSARTLSCGLQHIVAYWVLLLTYAGVLVITGFLRRVRPAGQRHASMRILVTGTFYNRGWFVSHAQPLAAAGLGEVVFIGDGALLPLPGVRVIEPPRWAMRLGGRAPVKLLWLLVLGLRIRPALVMGYHLFPGAISALLAARSCGARACYQMTGGPLEIIGGGAFNENLLMSRLCRPSPLLERLALAVIDCFDLVIVRGRRAVRYLRSHGVRAPIEVITGSIVDTNGRVPAARGFDLGFVGRLTEIKQPLQFVDIVAEVAQGYPAVQAAVIGDGPLAGAMRTRALERGLAGQITFFGQRNDVAVLLTQVRVFVLTSRSEGLSIAMVEAMAAGAVPVVADVGELSDLVASGMNGFLITPNEIGRYVEAISQLLRDPVRWERLSRSAARSARERVGVAAVARKWNRTLRGLFNGLAVQSA